MDKKRKPDTYVWLSLWKVDYTDYNFITGSELPLPDLSTDPVYTTFTQKYETLCGSQGTTSFGCCCLYFKDNFTDEITGEVYNEGDLTNEIIFSDCYECQKAAEAFNRDVIFLSGITVGGITSSHPSENPLCPATKTIQGLKERLEEDVYDLVPGSAKEFQYFQLKNHNNLGIMSVSLDFSNLSEAERTISVANPTIT
ncbi:MAG: hypothetical protein EBT92_16485, partial [Planctomycetes bacterium]|nr:hypothetical protein [Planctomycetota bacterium]